MVHGDIVKPRNDLNLRELLLAPVVRGDIVEPALVDSRELVLTPVVRGDIVEPVLVDSRELFLTPVIHGDTVEPVLVDSRELFLTPVVHGDIVEPAESHVLLLLNLVLELGHLLPLAVHQTLRSGSS